MIFIKKFGDALNEFEMLRVRTQGITKFNVVEVKIVKSTCLHLNKHHFLSTSPTNLIPIGIDRYIFWKFKLSKSWNFMLKWHLLKLTSKDLIEWSTW